jgi:hypothetical protein
VTGFTQGTVCLTENSSIQAPEQYFDSSQTKTSPLFFQTVTFATIGSQSRRSTKGVEDNDSKQHLKKNKKQSMKTGATIPSNETPSMASDENIASKSTAV